jgi:hypothetical protein
LAWFGSLDGGARAALVRGILEALEGIDPGLAGCMAIWRKGKTARFTARLPALGAWREVGVHVMVATSDPLLLPNLQRRAARGDLAFSEGWAESGSGHTEQAWVAPLGMGSVSVSERDGEFMLVAMPAQAVALPTGFEAGEPLPFGAPPGIVAVLFEGQIIIVFGFSSPSSAEAGALSASPVRLGLIEASPGMLLMCVHLPGVVDGWCEMPFSAAAERPANRHLIPPDAHGRMAVVLALADTVSSRIAALRVVYAPALWARRFADLVDGQCALPSYSRGDYTRDVSAAYARWPSRDAIARAVSHAVDAMDGGEP